ncbi:MAG: hypothetical protein ACOYO1_05120 [Bacteroidales bacterium]
MIKIKANNNLLTIYNDSKSISFSISRKDIFSVIQSHINGLNAEGCLFSIEKISEGKCIMILENYEKLAIPEITSYEITSRMLLLSKSLKMPNENIEDSL